jgi:hypothetical protein
MLNAANQGRQRPETAKPPQLLAIGLVQDSETYVASGVPNRKLRKRIGHNI